MRSTATGQPRTKPAEIRREELMDAAQALFLGKGFTETSVDEIVKGAGVAKGTYYVYFKTKDDVLAALRERFVARFLERLQTAADGHPPSDWIARFDRWIDAAVNTYLDERALHDLVFHQMRPTHDRLHQANPVVRDLEGLIAQGAQAGAWTADNAHLVAVMVFSAVHGAIDDAGESPGPSDRKRLVHAVQSFCRMGIGLPPAG
ncbi:AcrR family transcriptional regulator [Acidovorax soli]|uniref:AcrR family transcriptional regulator n=1 Tax=Acidovorax soli TaxID=592050 RepID=A0A7X0U7N2_9BURK|nr:TetR/AcrR family transcriptional regulator [Acidovorax soli]MBB6558241.1 AcrR family transcriptional regulator [Acidovorax soli]